MYARKEEKQADEQLFVQQQHQAFIVDGCGGGSRGGLAFPDAPPQTQIQWSLPPIHEFNPVSFTTNSVRDHDSFLGLPPRPPPPVSPFAGLFNRRGSDNPRTLSVQHGGHVDLCQSASQFGFQAEFGNMTAQEMIDAKALAASKSHSEAERRRRERINNHLAKLRSLLPNTTKTDKASLLAEVIQHVKELKRQTTQIEEASLVPTEIDEPSVDESKEEGKFVIKASLCCEDRPELLPDLIKTLKALKLRTLKAEITTLGGRVKNVLFITGDDDSNNKSNNQQQQQHYSISSIKECLKAVMERTTADDSSAGSIKRQTTNVTILEHGSL